MKKKLRNHSLSLVVTVFFLIPVAFYLTGDFSRRGALMEAVSLVTVLGLFMMLCQFFLSRNGNKLLDFGNISKVIKVHKPLGFCSIGIFLLHPFLVVLPKCFDDGIAPSDALLEMFYSYQDKGIFFGIIAWVLMFVLGAISIFKNKMGLRHGTWRKLHGVLAIFFILSATWHALATGRHMNTEMSVLIAALAGAGMLITINNYILEPQRKSKNHVALKHS